MTFLFICINLCVVFTITVNPQSSNQFVYFEGKTMGPIGWNGKQDWGEERWRSRLPPSRRG